VQQALSSAIRQLEARIGTPLFERTTRTVRLTAAGEALLPKARQALAAAEQAVIAARDAGRGVTGHLNVGLSRSAYRFGAPILHAMRQCAPTVHLEVRHGFVQPLIDGLAAGDLDAAIAFCPEDRPCLAYQRLSDQPAMVVVHPDHRLAKAATLRISDLREEILTVADPSISRGYNSAILSLYQREGITPRTVLSDAYIGPANVAPAQTVGIATKIALEGVPADSELVCIPLLDCTLPFDLVWHRDRDSPLQGNLRSVAAHVALVAGWQRI
jgi:DNA-binding transcriptional LysR family regulator